MTGRGLGFGSSGTTGPSPGGGGGSSLTTVTLLSTSGSNIPTATIFEGTLPIAANGLTSSQRLKILDSGNNVLSIQEDQHSYRRDTTANYVMVTGVIGTGPGATSTTLSVNTETGSPVTSNPITAANLLSHSFSGQTYNYRITVTLPDGTTYTANATDVLNATIAATYVHGTATNRGVIRQGPLCTEWVGYVPLKTGGGTAHTHLHVQFAIAAYKAGVGAYNSSTNPIVAVRTVYKIENGFKTVASPRDYAFDVLEQQGSTLTTVRNYNGAAGAVTLTLGATSGQTTATKASGSWPTVSTTTPEDNIIGKSIAEVGGTGIGYINGQVSSGVVNLSIPSDLPFASTNRSSAQWKYMGAYLIHRTSFCNIRFPGWLGTAQPAVWVLPRAYILASGMVQNIDTTRVPTTAYGSGAFSDVMSIEGSHPMAMDVNGGRIHWTLVNEGQQGSADGIGVLPYSQAMTLMNWENTSTHLAARKALEVQGHTVFAQPKSIRDEEHGGIFGLDDDAIYSNTVAAFQHQLYTTDNTSSVQNWFTFRVDHCTNYSYLAYLLRGHYFDLENLCYLGLYGTMSTNDYGQNLTYPCTLVGTNVVTTSTNEYQTGEAVKVVYNYGGFTPHNSPEGAIAPTNRYFWRRTNGTTGDLYDTYAHSIAGGATGKIVWDSDGTTPALWNGYNKSRFIDADQMRAQAWGNRCPILCASIFPSNLAAGIVGRAHTKTNWIRKVDNMLTYFKTQYVDDSNYQADGPRFLRVWKRPSWQKNYILTVFNFAVESGIASANGISCLNWWLADAIGMCTSPDVVPQFAACAYYLSFYKGDSSIAYTYDDFWDNANVKFPFLNSAGGQQMLVNGVDQWQYTGTISSVASQSNVTIVLNKDYFDNTSSTTRARHVGSWILCGSGFGQIKSVSDARTCVVDATVHTGWMDTFYAQEGSSIANANFATGSAQHVEVSWPTKGNGTHLATEVTGADGNTNIMRIGYGIDNEYAALADLSVEYAKQYSINSTNYANAKTMLTNMGVPTTTKADAIDCKWYIKSRV